MANEIRRINGLTAALVVLLGGRVGPRALKAADIIFYTELVPELSPSTGTFGTLDATTGAFTQISSGDPVLNGMAEIGGVLYGGGDGGLYTIDEATGGFALIGSGGVGDLGGGGPIGLFAIGGDQNLYSINATTGVATLIGPTGLPEVAVLSNNGGLYAIADDNLYGINSQTGAATLLFQTVLLFALTTEGGGVLNGASTTSGAIETINLSTEANIYGPLITGFSGAATVQGLVPATNTSTPEPSTVPGVGLALAALAWIVRRKKNRQTNPRPGPFRRASNNWAIVLAAALP